MNEPTENFDRESNPYSGRSLWPLFGFIAALLVINPLYAFFLEKMRASEVFFIAIYIGLLLGQLILVSAIASLVGRHWIVGFAAALGLSVLAMLSFCLIWPSFYRDGLGNAKNFTLAACILPAAILIAALPGLLLRLIRNWRISRSSEALSPIRIEDYLITMAILGSSIALFRAAYMIWDCNRMVMSSNENYIYFFPGSLIIGIGCYSFFFHLLALPAISISFRQTLFAERLLMVTGYALCVWLGLLFLAGIAVSLAGGGGFAGGEFVVGILIFLVMGALTLISGLEMMRYAGATLWKWRKPNPVEMAALVTSPEYPSSGLQIVPGVSLTKPPASSVSDPPEIPEETPIDPFSDDAELRAAAKEKSRKLEGSRIFARYFTACLVLFTILISVQAMIEQSRVDPELFERGNRYYEGPSVEPSDESSGT